MAVWPPLSLVSCRVNVCVLLRLLDALEHRLSSVSTPSLPFDPLLLPRMPSVWTKDGMKRINAITSGDR